MNAIQFIKEHGVDKAREVVEGAPKWAMSINFNNGMYYSRMEHKKGDTFLYDIKLLVERVDFINKFGGIGLAKAYDKEMGSRGFDPFYEKAIADYEAIYSTEL